MLHISNTPAHESNVLIALVTKSKANAILSRVAISPEHLTACRQIALIVCASNPFYICNPLHSVQFSCFFGVCWLFSKLLFFCRSWFGLNWLYLLSAVAELITRPKNICRWRLRPNFKGQFVRVLYYRICEQRMPRWAFTFAEYNHSLCCLNWKKEAM